MKNSFSVFGIGLVCLVCHLSCFDWSQDVHPEKWNKYAKAKLDEILNRNINLNIAKNIILFIGDGMGPTTVTGKLTHFFSVLK
jgi:hypothetical protein